MDQERLARVQALLGNACLEDIWEAPSTSDASRSTVAVQNPRSDSESSGDELVTSQGRSDLEMQSNSVKQSRFSSAFPEAHATGKSSTEEDNTEQEKDLADWEKGQLQLGQLAAEDEKFVPWKAIKRYPYCFIGNTNRPKVDKKFFAGGKLTERTWDIFYLYYTEEKKDPILLVPKKQFQHFLSVINKKLNISLTIPHVGRARGFEFSFPDNGTPRPRFLGRSTNTKTMTSLTQDRAPPKEFVPKDEIPSMVSPTDESIQAFKEKIDNINEAHATKLANKAKAKVDRIAQQKEWSHATKRVQRYLGLRDQHHDYSAEIVRIREKFEAQGLQWIKLARAVENEVAKLPTSVKFDPHQPSFYPQEGSVIFICVDIEAWERDQSIITEIGISTLDTDDIRCTPPGMGGFKWNRAIRSRHFRITEHTQYENKDFVRGCADKFEAGESEFINLADAPATIASCFKYPFSNPNPDPAAANVPRSLILVGHDVDSDINYLRKMGYNVSNLRNLKEKVDTAAMYRHLRREPNPRKLSHVLSDLGLYCWNLHNAGNDAIYTLRAMIAMAITHITDKEKNKERRAKELKERLDVSSTQEARERVLELNEGWSSAGESGDGEAVLKLEDSLAIRSKNGVQSLEESRPRSQRRGSSPKKTVGRYAGETADGELTPAVEDASPIKKSKVTKTVVSEMW
ncbi:QDE-2-interacting protein [Phlyctema vagabunda]|uniref:QDE-2-interacting protein n=1 Tax=Phlyctema vagabunda TaxID=108571 RepID=A0ABR4PK25_9HELO